LKPQARAILLADHVYRDLETGKCIIAGTFNRIGADRFPATHPSAALYLNITDFTGHAELKLRIASDLTGETLGEMTFGVESQTRLGGCEAVVRLNNISFPEPGRYSMEVYCAGEYLGHLPLELVQHPIEPEQEPGQGSDRRGET